MLADPRSLEALDFARVRERVAAATHGGRAAARALAMEPAIETEVVRGLVHQTSEMRALTRAHALSPGQIPDVHAPLEIAARGATLPARRAARGLRCLAAGAAAVRAIRDADLDLPALRACSARSCRCRTSPAGSAMRSTSAARSSIAPRPALARSGARLQAYDEARERTTALARSGRYARHSGRSLRFGRPFRRPIKPSSPPSFPASCTTRAPADKTLFVEPLETLETNNRVRALRAQEEHEVARILAELSALVGSHAGAIRADVAIAVELDLAHARAAVADRMDAVEPRLVDEATIDIRDGRHPLLEERAVPQSIRLDDDVRVTVISGPNMGGKTVALKMVGLFVAMTGCGMHLPAAEVTVGRFTRIFTDIGDEQSIALNTSTFSAHLGCLAEIVAGAGPRSLILIDEIGAGTEPGSGAALAVAVLERFIRSARAAW